MSIQNPDPEKFQEVSERGLASFSVLKKTESKAWEGNGAKKKGPRTLGLCFFSHHFSPMSGTLFFSEHLNLQVLSHSHPEIFLDQGLDTH